MLALGRTTFPQGGFIASRLCFADTGAVVTHSASVMASFSVGIGVIPFNVCFVGICSCCHLEIMFGKYLGTWEVKRTCA